MNLSYMLEDLVLNIGAENNFDFVCSRAQDFFKDFGISAVNIGIVDNQSSEFLGMSTSMDQGWIDYYFSQGLSHHDPLVAHLEQKREELVTVGFQHDYGLFQPSQNVVYRHAADAGYRNMYLKPIIQPSFEWSAGVNFCNDLKEIEANSYFKDCHEYFSLAAMIIGTRALATFNPDRQTSMWFKRSQFHLLAPRELEAVQWLASGLRTEQIADKMKVQPVTVHLHLKNARQKLKAKTREHLIAQAFIHHIL